MLLGFVPGVRSITLRAGADGLLTVLDECALSALLGGAAIFLVRTRNPS